MYVCKRVYIYIYIYICTHTNTYTRIVLAEAAELVVRGRLRLALLEHLWVALLN